MRKIKVTGLSAGFINEDAIGKVHIVTCLGDSEFTLCSYAFVDENYIDSSDKVDCENCLKDLSSLRKLISDFDKENKLK